MQRMHEHKREGIWECNGCNQKKHRDTTFNTWLRGRKTDAKQPSARCNYCYDKDEQTKQHMQRASTNMVMKTQPVEPVTVSTPTMQVSISCPQCRTQKKIYMAKCWDTMGRNRFIKERCTECKTYAHLGNWFRCKDENEQTISDCLSAIECFKIVVAFKRAVAAATRA